MGSAAEAADDEMPPMFHVSRGRGREELQQPGQPQSQPPQQPQSQQPPQPQHWPPPALPPPPPPLQQHQQHWPPPSLPPPAHEHALLPSYAAPSLPPPASSTHGLSPTELEIQRVREEAGEAQRRGDARAEAEVQRALQTADWRAGQARASFAAKAHDVSAQLQSDEELLASLGLGMGH
jgi:hypothetical protein